MGSHKPVNTGLWDRVAAFISEHGRKRQANILRGHKISIGERLEADLTAMRDLPATPFEACDPLPGSRYAVSMRGAAMITRCRSPIAKGAWRDNVFVERLWRTIKYEEVCLRAYASVSEARAGISRYLDFYNSRRPHSSLDGKSP